MEIKHTEEFELAFRFVNETNLNIFLTGKAGTGKTTFLKYLRENSLKEKHRRCTDRSCCNQCERSYTTFIISATFRNYSARHKYKSQLQ